MLNVVLVAPEIPANTGNIGRTCVVAGARLHLVGPLGFSLDERSVKRAGLAYWQSLDVRTYKNWDEFVVTHALTPNDSRLHLLTKKARTLYCEATYTDEDFLVFGSESTGLDEAILARNATRCERIPMLRDSDALTNADAWAKQHATTSDTGAPAHEPLLQQDICGNFVDMASYEVSALNVSNAAAIVCYEALRQLGFPHMDTGLA